MKVPQSKDPCRQEVCAGSVPGEDIVLSKWIGLEGTSHLARENCDSLKKRYPSWLVEEACAFDRYVSVLPEREVAHSFGVSAMLDAAEGGILTTFWQWAKQCGLGFTIDIHHIPVRQETVEVCEYLGVDPYRLLSGGCLLMTTRDGVGLTAALEQEGIPAQIAGKVTDSHACLLLNGDRVRYLDRPVQDELYRFRKVSCQP